MSKAALYRLGILNLALYRLARDRKATQQTFFLLRCFAIAQQYNSLAVLLCDRAANTIDLRYTVWEF